MTDKPTKQEPSTEAMPIKDIAPTEASGPDPAPEVPAPTALPKPPISPKRRLKIGSERSPAPQTPAELKQDTQPTSESAAEPKLKAKPNVPPTAKSLEAAAEHKRKNFPPPNIREQLPPELEKELEDALGGESLDSLIAIEDQEAESAELVPEARVQGTVVKIHRGDIFIELGGRNQGVLPLKQFVDADEAPPEPGAVLELVVARLNSEDGLYELVRPNVAVDVANWDDVREGTVVEVTITGSNKGGLECKVAGIRGFIPMGQISLYRVENPEEYVDQRLACVVMEVKRERRNLVLSHRAIMEREKAAAREKLLAELAPGQIREGTVRSLRDFGAFVDIGGIDGLVHISKISWDRVNHPSEVLEEGQAVKVRVEKIDPDSGKIALSYRDLMANPWDSVDSDYPVGMTVGGKVTKVMDFGAFVRLGPGVEGLIHISELAHGRVFRTSDVVSEGQEVDVKILAVDRSAQRIGLSLRALLAKPEREGDKTVADEDIPLPKDAPKVPSKKKGDLKGGVGRSSGGEKFGLKW